MIANPTQVMLSKLFSSFAYLENLKVLVCLHQSCVPIKNHKLSTKLVWGEFGENGKTINILISFSSDYSILVLFMAVSNLKLLSNLEQP